MKKSPGLTKAPGSQLKHKCVKVTGPKSHTVGFFSERQECIKTCVLLLSVMTVLPSFKLSATKKT